jgi:hypothetical protein
VDHQSIFPTIRTLSNKFQLLRPNRVKRFKGKNPFMSLTLVTFQKMKSGPPTSLLSLCMGLLIGSSFSFGCLWCCLPMFKDRGGFVRGVGIGMILSGCAVLAFGLAQTQGTILSIPFYAWVAVGTAIAVTGVAVAARPHSPYLQISTQSEIPK